MSLDYELVKTVEDPEEGLITADITSRGRMPGAKRFTFCIRRDYATDQGMKRTGWFTRAHLAALRRVIDDVERELNELENRDKEERKALLKKARESGS